MRRRTALLTVGAVAAAATATAVIAYGGESPVATGGADCDRGVWVQATGYSGDDQNSLSVNLDGEVQQEQFQTGDVLIIRIPHDSKPRLWVWSVGSTDQDESATEQGVITCDAEGNATRGPAPTSSSSSESASTNSTPSTTVPSPTPTRTGKPSPTATTTSAPPEPSGSSTPKPTPTPKDTGAPSPSSSPTPTEEPTPTEDPTPTPTEPTSSATSTTSPSAD